MGDWPWITPPSGVLWRHLHFTLRKERSCCCQQRPTQKPAFRSWVFPGEYGRVTVIIWHQTNRKTWKTPPIEPLFWIFLADSVENSSWFVAQIFVEPFAKCHQKTWELLLRHWVPATDASHGQPCNAARAPRQWDHGFKGPCGYSNIYHLEVGLYVSKGLDL